MEINFSTKKKLIENIQNLSIDHQRQIFYILQKYLENNLDNTKWYSKNQNGIFINFSVINDKIINDIEIFIKECNNKENKIKELEKELELIENKEICYKIISENNVDNEKEDFNYILNIIDNNLLSDLNKYFDKKNNKKQNLQTKFINATKRYTKCVNTEKKFEETNNFFLDYEKYKL